MALKLAHLVFGANVFLFLALQPQALRTLQQSKKGGSNTMLRPRCGVPNPDHHHNTSLGDGNGMVANYEFFPNSPKWEGYQLTYNFSSTGVQNVVSLSVLRPVIERAFKRWSDVSPFTFQEAAQGTPANISIGFYRGNHGDDCPFNGPGDTVAFAYAPPDGRFHYDADENWSANPTSSDQVDLEGLAVHEIGHNLGLDHSDDTNAIMYEYISKRELGQDDIDGLQALYGY